MKGKKKRKDSLEKKDNFSKIAIIVIILVSAFFIRVYNINKVQNTFCFIEGTDMIGIHREAMTFFSDLFSQKEPFYRVPTYPFFVASIYSLLGDTDPMNVKFIHVLMGVGICFLIFFLTKQLFGYRTGVIALLISAFYKMFIIHEALLLAETFAAFFITLSIFTIFLLQAKPTYKRAIISGIALGMSTLLRGNFALGIPFLLFWLYFKIKKEVSFRKTLYILTIVIFSQAILIAPITLRNYIVSGKFVPISTNGIPALWLGTNPYADVSQDYPPKFYYQELEDRIKKDGIDKVYMEEIKKFITKQTKVFLNLEKEKFLYSLSALEIPNNLSFAFFQGASPILKLPIFFSFGIIAILTILSFFLTFPFRHNTSLLIIFVGMMIIALLPYSILARFRLPYISPLIILAAFSINWYISKFEQKEYKKVCLSLIPLFLAILFVYWIPLREKLGLYLYPNGKHIIQPKRIVIRDSSSSWAGGNTYSLHIPEQAVKKEFIVTENLKEFVEAGIYFNFFGGNEPGTVEVNINNKIVEVPLKPSQGLLIYGNIKFPAEWLKQGKNTFVFKPIKKADLSIPIDENSYFARSYYKNSEKEGWNLIKGELKIELELYKEKI